MQNSMLSRMRISDLNWMQVEELLKREDRCVLPLGSTEQHAYLSLSADSLLAERMAVEAAEPLGVPVFSVMPFGMTPQFMAYPGTVNLKLATYASVLVDVLQSLFAHGFRRIMILNGHGGNVPAAAAVNEWKCTQAEVRVKWHDWWRAPATWARAVETDPVASHASWMENFPWTRVPGVNPPATAKTLADFAKMRLAGPQEMREILGDGNFGGLYERSDEEMAAIWGVAVEETRGLLEGGWG